MRLRSADADDLRVLAACLEDALVPYGAMSYLPRQRRFAAVLNRFCWEAETEADATGDVYQRVRCGVHFDSVLAVKTQGLERVSKNEVLSLLTIACDPGEEGAATLTLVFAGGAAIRLEVECIDGHLEDLGEPWPAKHKPGHFDDEQSPRTKNAPTAAPVAAGDAPGESGSES